MDNDEDEDEYEAEEETQRLVMNFPPFNFSGNCWQRNFLASHRALGFTFLIFFFFLFFLIFPVLSHALVLLRHLLRVGIPGPGVRRYGLEEYPQAACSTDPLCTRSKFCLKYLKPKGASTV